MWLVNHYHFGIGGFLFKLITKAFKLTGIAGGYGSSFTSSIGTVAKAHKTKRNVPGILPGTFLFSSLIYMSNTLDAEQKLGILFYFFKNTSSLKVLKE